MSQFDYGSMVITSGESKRHSEENFAACPLGTIGRTPDGRFFRYSKASSAAIGAGRLTQLVPAHTNLRSDLDVAEAAEAGALYIPVTTPNNAQGDIVKDQFKGGYIFVMDNAGEGHLYTIESHEAVARNSRFDVPIMDDSLAVAVGTTTDVGLVEPFGKVQIHDQGGSKELMMGVAPVAVAANEYFWNQFRGLCTVLVNGTAPAVGEPVVADDSNDGAVERAGASDSRTPQVGVFTGDTVSSAQFGLVYLTLG